MLFEKGVLKGKVAIVTGGNTGIGKGISESLASKGCKVVVGSLSEEKTKNIFVKCDVSNIEDVKRLIAETLKKYKKIDILVNNAGIYPYKAFREMTKEDWDKVMNINLNGTYNCIKEALPYLDQQPNAKIINIASIAGTTVGFNNLVHYSASKGAIMGMTKALAIELGPKIQVNAIAPGAILTPGVSNSMDGAALENFAKAIPSKRIGLPADIGELTAFLASEGSNYITGQTIVCDGGYTVQ